MSRDREKYAYYLIGIAKDSRTYSALLADVERCGVKHIPTLIGVRLGDYYEGGRVIQRPVSEPEQRNDGGYSDAALSNADVASNAWPED